MGRRVWAALLALLAFVALSGCSGIPSGGPSRVVRRVPAKDEEPPEPRAIRVPTNPEPNASPNDIVLGYLTAQTDPGDDYAIARKYLAPQVTWNPGARVLIHTRRTLSAPVVNEDTATVRATVRLDGTVSAAGEYQPARSSSPTVVTFRLRRVDSVGWRVFEAPPGLLLSRDELTASLQRAVVYWPDSARRLVPEVLFLPVSDQPAVTVVRALLAGPRGWLAPAVRSAIPRGTELLDPPTVVDGVLQLNFSREIRTATQETVATLVAQVVWTLTEPGLDVSAVRLFAEREPIVVPEKPSLRDHRRGDWVEFAPVPPTEDRRLFFVRDGAPYALDDAGRLSRRLATTPPLASLAVNRAGSSLAGVTRTSGGHQRLVVASLTGPGGVRTLLTADGIGSPTWEPGGDVVWVVQRTGAARQVVAVRAAGGGGGGVASVPSALPGPASEIRLSPDGARALLVVGSGVSATLWVARVERTASGGRVLGDPRPLAPAVRGVTAAAFDGTAQVSFAALVAGRPALYRVDVDGFDLARQRDTGLPAAAVGAVAVSSDAPADRVASVAGRLWRRTPGAEWAALPGRGTAAAFAG